MRFAPLSPVIPQLVYMRVCLYRYIYGPYGKSGAVLPKEVPKICNNHVFHFSLMWISSFLFFLHLCAKKEERRPASGCFSMACFWLFFSHSLVSSFCNFFAWHLQANSHNTFCYFLIHVLILDEHLPNSFMYSSKFSDLSSLYFLPTKDAIF